MRAKYPENIKEFDNLPKLLRDYVFNGIAQTDWLSGGRPVITQGSCFARNLAASLAKHGGKVAHMNVNEFINTTYANRLFFHWVSGENTKATGQFLELFGNQCTDQGREEFRACIKQAAVFILTVGVAPWWIHTPTRAIVLQPNMRKMGEYEMRTSSIGDNVVNLEDIIGIVRTINPAIEIMLTLSPAPLNQTFEFNSAIVGDCVSKSVLRVALHEIMNKKLPRVHYWPSFEVVRWVGSHVGNVFGAEDEHPRHVSNFIVDHIISAFMERNGWDLKANPKSDKPDEFQNMDPFVMHRNF